MLEALERGNEGRKWHTLMDKVMSPKTLHRALETVTAHHGAAGVDGQTVAAVKQRANEEVTLIQRLLQEGRYEPRPVQRHWIEKWGRSEKRPLGIPTVRDRIVQTAMVAVMEPIFEIGFAENSYGFRTGRNARQAVEQVEALLRAGCVWVVDADLKGYFDSIPQDRLMGRVREKIADSSLTGLLEKFLKQGVMDTAKGWQPTESGTPQGAVLSPLLANIYLNPLDHQMAQRGRQMIRYADDFVILCRSQAEAQEVLDELRDWVKAQGLSLHPEKTRIVCATQPGGFDFLGWHFERGLRWPRDKSQARFKESIRSVTRRSSGQSMESITMAINRQVRGWGRYFRGGVRNVPHRLEQWIRMRLRSILRQRAGRKGRGRGLDHQRYPNSYFAEHGVISLLSITHVQLPTPLNP
jgi:RNA-directed DNA polymerase